MWYLFATRYVLRPQAHTPTHTPDIICVFNYIRNNNNNKWIRFRYVRIWIEDIDEPIIELCDGFEPIKSAAWCPTNSTIIACTTPTSVQIWDLKTDCLTPAAVHRLTGSNQSSTDNDDGHHDGGSAADDHHNADDNGNGNGSNADSCNANESATDAALTVCQFTHCGRSIVVGCEDGTAFVFAIDDMPASSHFQYDALEEAIMRSLTSKWELERKIKQLGYLGF